jgi:hypothetical protein
MLSKKFQTFGVRNSAILRAALKGACCKGAFHTNATSPEGGTTVWDDAAFAHKRPGENPLAPALVPTDCSIPLNINLKCFNVVPEARTCSLAQLRNELYSLNDWTSFIFSGIIIPIFLDVNQNQL